MKDAAIDSFRYDNPERARAHTQTHNGGVNHSITNTRADTSPKPQTSVLLNRDDGGQTTDYPLKSNLITALATSH